MDVHVRRAVTQGLRRRGIDVVTAQDDGSASLPDHLLSDRARQLDRVIFSQDDDLLREARQRQPQGDAFAGVIFAHQLRITIGQTVRDLELLAKVYETEDMENRVEYLPL
jgi:hypothetical protein